VTASDVEAARFARQLGLAAVGEAGLARIRGSSVHVVGAGPVAGPALLALVQAGVGILYLDDGADVGPFDARTWLCTPAQVGQPRVLAAMEALRAASSLTTVRLHATGTRSSAALVCAETQGTATLASERERTAGVAHVVALASDEGGAVISIPPGAPCIRCASRPGASTQPRGGMAAAIGNLGALELLLLIVGAGAGASEGRRVELRDGRLDATPTLRRPGCDCHVVY